MERIASRLGELDGVAAVKGSAKHQEVTVSFRPAQVGHDRLIAAMEEIGYPVDREASAPLDDDAPKAA